MIYSLSMIGKVDSYVEQVARKLAVYMNDVMEDQKDKVLENLLANGMDLPTYMTRFQWDMAKYPIKQSLKNLSDIIGKDLTWTSSLLIKFTLKIIFLCLWNYFCVYYISFWFSAKQVGSIEADLKQKSSAYNALKVINE